MNQQPATPVDSATPYAELTLYETSPARAGIRFAGSLAVAVGALLILLYIGDLAPFALEGPLLAGAGGAALLAGRRRANARLTIAAGGITYFDGSATRNWPSSAIGGATIGGKIEETGVAFDDGSGSRDWSFLAVNRQGAPLLRIAAGDFWDPAAAGDLLADALAEAKWAAPTETDRGSARASSSGLAREVDLAFVGAQYKVDRWRKRQLLIALPLVWLWVLLIKPAIENFFHNRSVASRAEAAAEEWTKHAHAVALETPPAPNTGRIVLSLRLGDQLIVDGQLAKIEALLVAHERSILPQDARVAVDLPAGEHQIELTVQGAQPTSAKVQVIKSEIVEIDVLLVSAAPAAP